MLIKISNRQYRLMPDIPGIYGQYEYRVLRDDGTFTKWAEVKSFQIRKELDRGEVPYHLIEKPVQMKLFGVQNG